jgi:hypothetical protein
MSDLEKILIMPSTITLECFLPRADNTVTVDKGGSTEYATLVSIVL